MILAASLSLLATAAPKAVGADGYSLPSLQIVATVRSPDPTSQRLEIELLVPTAGRDEITLRWARWTPGFYKVEDYVGAVEKLTAAGVSDAHTADRQPLRVERSSDPASTHRWRIPTQGARWIAVSYRLRADSVSVTTNWAGPDLLVLNPAATFPALGDVVARPYEIRLVLPSAWDDTATALRELPTGAVRERRYWADDYDQLVDSPIVAGRLLRRAFHVGSAGFEWVDVNPPATWDPSRTLDEIRGAIGENAELWGDLPFARYVFLNVFRRGRGGLEHRDSTLLTTDGEAVATAVGYRRWIAFVTHEFVHAYNVKRLRPIELGPFDYEREPRTPSLWVSEGLTTYVAHLTLARSGAWRVDEFLDAQGDLIADLQSQPGRLAQTLEQSSLEVWNNSTSGVSPSSATVSYYVKGAVVGFLLDVRLRRLTDGRRSLDDLLRLAYSRHGGPRGFTPVEFRAAAREIAGDDLESWFQQVVASTAELDYGEALAWFGLRFAQLPSSDPADSWKLEVDPSASEVQRGHLAAWVAARSKIP